MTRSMRRMLREASRPRTSTAPRMMAGARPMPNSSRRATTTPMNSAISVASIAPSATSQYPSRAGVRSRDPTAAARSWPVAMPSLADRYWSMIAVRLAATSTQSSW